MNYYKLLLIPVALGGFVAFWCFVVKMVALMGWQQLAARFAAAGPVAGPRYPLQQARIGTAKYQGVAQASVSADGLGLTTNFLFRAGHAPLLIPWSAFEPFQAEKVLWLTLYKTSIRTSATECVHLTFSNSHLMAAMQPWVAQQQTT